MCGTGAFAVVLECVPAKFRVDFQVYFYSHHWTVWAMGCDGQVLVYQDMLGMYSDFVPKFVKNLAMWEMK